MYLLVESAALIEKKCKKKDLGFGDVMEEATRMGPKCLQKCVGGNFRRCQNFIVIFGWAVGDDSGWVVAKR